MTRINQPYTSPYDLSSGAVLGPPTPSPYRPGVSLTGLVNAQEAQLCEQRKENALLRGVINEQRTALTGIQRRIAAENDAFSRQAKTSADLQAENKRLIGRLDHLRKVNDTLRSTHSADEEIKGLKNRVGDLQARNKMLLRSRDNLQKANDTLRSQASDRRVEAVGLREQLREQGKRCASAGESQSYVMLCDERKVTADLRKTNEALRTAMASKHKRMLEAQSHDCSAEVARLKKRLHQQNEVVDRLTADRRETDANLKRKVASRDLAIERGAKRVRWLEGCQTNQAETIAEHRDAKAKLNRDISQLQSTIMRYVEDLRLVRKVNAELLAERAAGLNASATTERRTLQQVIDRQRSYGVSILRTIAQRDTEIKDMKHRVQFLEALVAERDGTIQARRKKIQATQDEVVVLNRTIKGLKRQMINQGDMLITKNRKLDLQESTLDTRAKTICTQARMLDTKDKMIAEREAYGRLLHREIDVYKADRDIARRDAYDFRVARDKAQSALAVEVRVTSHLGDMVEAFSMALDCQVTEEEKELGAMCMFRPGMTTTSRREQ